MLILKKLDITNNNPLTITFLGKLKKETLIDGKYNYEFYTREKNVCMQCPIDEMTYYITDKNKIKKILSYFFKKCDQHKSPQSLWETTDGDKYQSLLKDYEIENIKDFDIVCDELLEYLNEKYETDKKYIASVEIAYPKTWLVEYERKEDSNV